ncbi:hypothetical protein EKM05_01475 [Flavobacterium sp. GSP27]|uniref:hypothetical protein n=1 Tax=Flavobacterium sp. GSP27 TaxID=2497489 RepID=UPI000F81AA7E|nr:hypothetical protein [Flavobacterium sp. GSP27]RTZ11337.1 hypothetical protein EKM05_01475 [Flavobacterium sp. GSP27]
MYDYLFGTNTQNAFALAEKYNLSEYDRDYILHNYWPIIKVSNFDTETIKEKLNTLKNEFIKENTIFDLEIFNRENTTLLIYELNQYIDILKRGKVKTWDKYDDNFFHIFKTESDIPEKILLISDKNITQLEVYFKSILNAFQSFTKEQTGAKIMIKKLPQLEDVFFVHYQCDNFEDGNQITSLSIFANDKTIEFYNDTESENIEKYCKKVFELCNSGLIPIHWGQNKTYYGIDHIISRYKELTGKTIELEYNNNINLSRWLIYAYGERYIAHPRLDNLAILNEFNGITNKESKIFHTNRLVLLTKIYYNALNNTLKTESKPLDLSDTPTVENKIIVIKEPYGKMFSNNGFELFEYLLNEHVKPKETKGRKSDLIYYYWEMYNSKTQYIHQRPATFFKWFDEKYNETTGQLKTYNNVKTPQRIKDYSTALGWFKSKNKECTVSVP